jgi:hypothetical protein
MGHTILKGGRIVTSSDRIATAPTIAANVLRDGATVAWYDSSDLTTITKDGSDFVSRWNDKLGSGHDLIQATAASQPKWYTGDGVLFDGVNDFMKTGAFIYIQPNTIYIVFKMITYTRNNTVFDGYNTYSGGVWTETSSPMLNLYYGESLFNSTFSVGNYGIIRAKVQNINSKLQINNLTASMGNVGNANLNGFTLASRGLGDLRYGNIQVKEVILRNVADNADDETAIYNYLASKYGFTTI